MEIVKILNGCVTNANEPGSVFVKAESLMGFEGWIHEERAKAAFEAVVAHVRLLPKPFLDIEGGWTFLNLPFFDDGNGGPGKQWGGQRDAGLLILICSHYGIFQDPLHTLGFKNKCIADLPGGVTYCSFNCQELFLNMVRNHLGLK